VVNDQIHIAIHIDIEIRADELGIEQLKIWFSEMAFRHLGQVLYAIDDIDLVDKSGHEINSVNSIQQICTFSRCFTMTRKCI
jgi:hypothetical protein